MNNELALCRLLADGQFHSGQDCARELNVSRSAIHKIIQKLQNQFQLPIDSVTGRGYRIPQGLVLLDAECIKQQLAELHCEQCDEVLVFPQLESTNQYLTTLASIDKSAATQNILCLAEGQTAGRGRHGRDWYSPFARNLYFSLQWICHQDLFALRGLSLLIGLAIARTLVALGIDGVGLKWPNDVLIQGKKVAGILLEVSGDISGPSRVIIGVGVNVNMSSLDVGADLINQPWCDLASVSSELELPDRNTLASMLVNEIFKVLNQHEQNKLDSLLSEWSNFDILQNQEIEIRAKDKIIKGVHVGINEVGELQLRELSTNKVQVINSGEIQ